MSLKWADLVTQREDGRHSDEGLAAVTVVAIAKKKKELKSSREPPRQQAQLAETKIRHSRLWSLKEFLETGMS